MLFLTKNANFRYCFKSYTWGFQRGGIFKLLPGAEYCSSYFVYPEDVQGLNRYLLVQTDE